MKLSKIIIFGLISHLVIAVQSDFLTHVKKSLWSSAAITIPGLFDFMFGTTEKYQALKVPEFDFPPKIDRWDVELRNERDFIEFLLRNEWIQRRVGIKMWGSNGLFPDIKGEVFDGTGLPIRVEVEYWAENYKMHGHPFGGCHLILSFFRQPTTRIIRGVPVWSFYSGKKSTRDMNFCLYSDINFDHITNKDVFNNRNQQTEEYNPEIFDGKKWIRLSDDPALYKKYLNRKGVTTTCVFCGRTKLISKNPYCSDICKSKSHILRGY